CGPLVRFGQEENRKRTHRAFPPARTETALGCPHRCVWSFGGHVENPCIFLTPGPVALTLATMGSIPRYPRSYGPRMSWGRMLTPAIRNIIIACTGVFLVQTLLNLLASPAVQRFYLTEFGLVPLAVVHGLRIWQPFTYLFL